MCVVVSARQFAPAPPPSDILWENLGVSRKNQMFRSCLAWMCFIVLLVISFALITVVTSMQSSLQQVDDATCAASQCGELRKTPLFVHRTRTFVLLFDSSQTSYQRNGIHES